MELSELQLEGFRAAEEALWAAKTRGDLAWMDRILGPNFTEHGASGKVWDRDSIMTIPISDHIPIELPLPNFAVRLLAPTVALVTYVSIVDGVEANRASVWRQDGERWQLEFHQGTPAVDTAPGQVVGTPAQRHTIDAAYLRSVSFKTKRPGYERAHVQQFLTGLVAAIDAGEQITQRHTAAARFAIAPKGYDRIQVDEFFADLGKRLA